MDNVTLLGTKGEWGGGPAFDTFSLGKAGSINKLCDEKHLKKDPSAAAPLQCWSMCRQISHASVSRNTFKKVHNIGHNEFSALHPYCKKKNAVSGGNKPKKLVTKGFECPLCPTSL